MGLTDDERRRLDELAAGLASEDPRLGEALSGSAPHRASRCWACRLRLTLWLVFTLSMPLAVTGALMRLPLLFVLAGTAIVATALTFSVIGRDGSGR